MTFDPAWCHVSFCSGRFLEVCDFNLWNFFASLWLDLLLASCLTSLLRGFTWIYGPRKAILHPISLCRPLFHIQNKTASRDCIAIYWSFVQNARPFASLPKHSIAKKQRHDLLIVQFACKSGFFAYIISSIGVCGAKHWFFLQYPCRFLSFPVLHITKDQWCNILIS